MTRVIAWLIFAPRLETKGSYNAKERLSMFTDAVHALDAAPRGHTRSTPLRHLAIRVVPDCAEQAKLRHIRCWYQAPQPAGTD